MKKKILLLTGLSTLVVATVGAVLASKSAKRSMPLVGVDDYYTLTINGGDFTKEGDFENAHGSVDLATDSTKEAAPANQNKVTFDFEYAPYGNSDGKDYTYLTQNSGKIWNSKSSPIRSMSQVEIIGYGNVIVSWGWLDETNEIHYYNSQVLNIGGGGETSSFAGYTPNYLKISAPSYSAPGIEKIIISYDKSCTLSENPFFVDNGLKFVKYGDNGAQVLGFSGELINPLVIPSEVNGLTVTSIDQGAFQDTYNLTSVTIPNTITDIGSYAFYSCDDLATVIFQSGGTEDLYFGDNVFGGVSSLTGTFTIPKRAANCLSQYALQDMKTTSAFAFEDNYADGEYYCVDGVVYRTNHYGTYLHTYPMAKTDTTFTVPASVTGFNSYVGLSNNEYLETVIFANTGALTLNEYCVSNCQNLTSVQFNGSGAVTLEWYPFSGCSSLAELVLPANTILESRALGGLGNEEEHPISVFFDGNDTSSWHTDNYGNGPWYEMMGSYCNVYLKSDAEIAAGDLPEHVAGSWHYVADEPTPFAINILFTCYRTDIGSGYAFYLLGADSWTASEANRGTYNNSKSRWEVVLKLVPGTTYEFKGAISTWDNPESITYEEGSNRSWAPDRLSNNYTVDWHY
ncbi:MAG: leucine-rich repeat domain-containing protein [Bacilli bacterium]|nr:leucine-rich repeat domain-containing protein [Bacilli bacterium]